MREVRLGGVKAAGRVALVDDEDYDLVMQHKWHVWERTRPGCRTDGPYAATVRTLDDGRRSYLLMHKLITGWPRTDHEDHDGLNNQRSNLRPATVAQNTQNQRPKINRSSRFKGVTWHKKRKKWQAFIEVNRKNRYLGSFVNEEDAAAAYQAAALEAFGEYAYKAQGIAS